MAKKHHCIAYLIVSFIVAIAITFGISNWIVGEGGDVMSQFWVVFPGGLVLGFVLGLFVYCYAASEAQLI